MSKKLPLDFFDLDDTRLDEEWAQQSKHYYEHALELADARAALERAKARRDLVAAEVDRDIRADPAKYNLEKITEPAVEKQVTLSRRYAQANEEVIEAKHTVDVLFATVEALEQRKKALEGRTSLWLGNYYSDAPPKDKASREAREESQKKSIRAKTQKR
jgi:hypothetical protein